MRSSARSSTGSSRLSLRAVLSGSGRLGAGWAGAALAAAVVCLGTMVYYNLLIAGLFVALGALGGVYFALTPKQRERAASR